MRITEFLKLEAVVPQLSGRTKGEVLQELANALVKIAPHIPATRIHEVLSEREKIGSTGMEKGVAIPHGRLAELSALVAQFPVSLELAGVILLMALFGAVVLARRQMTMAEDERRAAAGLSRIDDDASLSRGGAA
jgi:hypothetical protein